jgi:hypothetical protein
MFNTLIELDKYHHVTQKQISNTFQRLFDNLPEEIMSQPIDQCQRKGLFLLS